MGAVWPRPHKFRDKETRRRDAIAMSGTVWSVARELESAVVVAEAWTRCPGQS